MSEPLDKEFKQVILRDYGDSFTFGKYRGRTIAEIIAKDPQYIVWAHNNVDFFKVKSGVLATAVETVREQKQAKPAPDKPLFGRPKTPPKFLDDEADDDIPF